MNITFTSCSLCLMSHNRPATLAPSVLNIAATSTFLFPWWWMKQETTASAGASDRGSLTISECPCPPVNHQAPERDCNLRRVVRSGLQPGIQEPGERWVTGREEELQFLSQPDGESVQPSVNRRIKLFCSDSQNTWNELKRVIWQQSYKDIPRVHWRNNLMLYFLCINTVCSPNEKSKYLHIYFHLLLCNTCQGGGRSCSQSQPITFTLTFALRLGPVSHSRTHITPKVSEVKPGCPSTNVSLTVVCARS